MRAEQRWRPRRSAPSRCCRRGAGPRSRRRTPRHRVAAHPVARTWRDHRAPIRACRRGRTTGSLACRRRSPSPSTALRDSSSRLVSSPPGRSAPSERSTRRRARPTRLEGRRPRRRPRPATAGPPPVVLSRRRETPGTARARWRGLRSAQRSSAAVRGRAIPPHLRSASPRPTRRLSAPAHQRPRPSSPRNRLRHPHQRRTSFPRPDPRSGGLPPRPWPARCAPRPVRWLDRRPDHSTTRDLPATASRGSAPPTPSPGHSASIHPGDQNAGVFVGVLVCGRGRMCSAVSCCQTFTQHGRPRETPLWWRRPASARSGYRRDPASTRRRHRASTTEQRRRRRDRLPVPSWRRRRRGWRRCRRTCG